ncbi:LysM peptidoglycan-binding domain-containing protein [Agromyces larvae]|uniref:LysM peptidoglycan-binding domain-containing protein n=1 Tax=Agromyces larvae TaxID=2929802 RepID=A0ABY4C0R3_9MICO|nr:LysM peptidoglycan-binding domain-containing protein [Agromyces larvae]UOE44769.1 LysM peptidoglycan-binding domain-containing protein [Agromyces larvae]
MSSFAAIGSVGGFSPSAPRSSSAPRTRLRLTRRGRVVLTALAGVPVALLAAVMVLGAGAAAAESDLGGGATSFRTVTVAAGDTLWELAESIAPGEDPRDVIGEILRINGLRDGAIQPGQQLALPVVE